MNGIERLALAVLQPGFAGVALPTAYADLLADGLGGVCLFGSNTSAGPDAVAALCAAVHAANPGAGVAIDEEGGDVTRLHDRTGSPVLGAAALGALDNVEVTRRTGRAVGAELADAGIDLTLAPVADVNSDPDNPVIGTRSFGEDAAAVASHAVAWLQGVQGAGVAACVKHFPGHGDTATDSHLALPELPVGRDVLVSRELVPFEAAIGAGVAAVMTAHIVVPAIDPARPATLSPPVLRMVRDLGFTGAIVTDALDMTGITGERTMAEAAVMALAAGADVLALGPGRSAEEIRAVQAAIVAAVRSGRLAADRVAEAGDRAAGLRGLDKLDKRDERGTTDVGTDGLPPAAGSLRVEGLPPQLAGARVVTIATSASIAVGDVPWGLPADVRVSAAEPDAWQRIDLDRPVVVQVRDLHRHAWAADVVRRLAARGQVVLVEWGWPGPPVADVPRILTHGWSLPGERAVTDLLREAGWDR